MKELEITIRARNNRLKQRREELGLSQRELSRQAGICCTTYNSFENLRLSPLGSMGDWREPARKLSAFHGVGLEELFPDSVLQIEAPSATLRMDATEVPLLGQASSEIMGLLPSDVAIASDLHTEVEKALSTLTSREERVIRMRFGIGDRKDHTLEEVGKELGTQKARAGQIEKKALRKLRRPSRSKWLKSFVES